MVVYALKPLLMISLAGWYWVNAPKPLSRVSVLLLVSLFFSLWGDVFLMIQPRGELLFLCGLFSFLLAHLCYINAYRIGSPAITQGILRRQWWWAIPLFLFEAGLLWLIAPKLSFVALPVGLYATVLVFMVLFALNRWGSVPQSSFTKVVLGALIFMASDSMIALNAFYQPIPSARLLILSTYCLAQWLIIWGMLESNYEL